ncbi:N-acetyltransferase [Nocardiopsis coralliicola]
MNPPIPRAAGVELVRLDQPGARAERARAAVGGLRLAPGQRRFVQPAAATLPAADADPDQYPFAVLAEGRTIGFGILDAAQPAAGGIVPGGVGELARDGAVLLRSFLITVARQGEGAARAACRALPGLAREVAPAAREVLLTVNEANPAALRAYTAGGFADTGRRYLGGPAGPQQILRMELP